MKNKRKEEVIHLQICEYLRRQYKDVIFLSDLSGIKMSIGLATKVSKMKSERGIPDLIILEAKYGFNGLCIEIKKNSSEIYCKNGELRTEKHILEQNKILTRLANKGYMARFGCGFDHCKEIIDNYLK